MINFAGDFLTLFLPLFVALLLGALIGIERSIAGKTAGMRTYGLVAMSATLFILTSQLLPDDMQGDVLRFPAGIISGIGFIGAGLIIFKKEQSTLSGLTTAAGLWICAGVGIAVGYGFYALALAATLLTLVVFSLLWDFEQVLVKAAQARGIYSEEEKEEKQAYEK